MGKYEVGYWVETIYGIGCITKIWPLNEKITVFEIKHIREEKIRNVFYGEILQTLYIWG